MSISSPELHSSISEHHFAVSTAHDGGEATFRLTAENLKPYLITEGVWSVRPLYLGGELVPPPADDFQGFVLKSPNAITENEKPLIMASMAAKMYEEGGHFLTFPPDTAPIKISMPSDRLDFELKTVKGAPAVFKHSGLLGISLIQVVDYCGGGGTGGGAGAIRHS